MTTFPAIELDADGLPVPIVAVLPDIAALVDPGEPPDAPGIRLEAAQATLTAVAEACLAGLDRVQSDRIAQAVGLRLLSLLVRLQRQPLGCTDLAELARKVGTSRNATWAAAERALERLPGEPRDRSPNG